MNETVANASSLEHAVRHRDWELAELSRVATMGQIASGLAHELTQPLGAILNYAGACMVQLETRPEVPVAVLGLMREVLNETRRAGAICSKMRLMNRKQLPACVPVNINDLATESLQIMDRELYNRGVRVSRQLTEQLPMASGDSIQLLFVLAHLMENACEAMADNPADSAELTVTTSVSADRNIHVSIADSGKRMGPEELRRLFEPFFTTKPRGLGMGLATCRGMIENMGGQLVASTNAPRGMVFTATIPAARG